MMKLLLITMAATLIAAGWIVWSKRSRRAPVTIPAPIRTVIHRDLAGSPPATPGRVEVSRYPSPWAALHAGDHPAFVQLLRDSGCPEETVRLFTLAALGRKLQKQVEGPEEARVKTGRYWRDEARPEEQLQWVAEMRRQRSALEQALAGLVQMEGAAFRREFIELYRGTDWLPAAQRNALETLLSRQVAEVQAQERLGLTGLRGLASEPGERAEFLELRQRHRQELEQLLGAAGLAEYEARESMEANYVLQHLPPARSEDEFRQLVAAAREVGFNQSDIGLDDVPAGVRMERPRLKNRVLDRFRARQGADRAAELQEAVSEEDQRREQQEKIETENRLVSELQAFAKQGGVDLPDAEARALNTALRQRGAALDRELGDPSQLPESERAQLMERIRAEMEKVGVDVIGDKGRIVVEQIWKNRK